MSRRKHSSARARAKRPADEDQTRAAPDNGRASISHQAPLLERMAHDPRAPSLSTHQLRGLQAARGNRYVQRMFKRTPEAQDQHTRALGPAGAVIASGAPTAYVQRSNGGAGLQADRFAGDPVLEACYSGQRVLKVGDRGPAVEKIQQALVDAGCKLPKYGPDGKFRRETKEAVRAFQEQSGVVGSSGRGVIGERTMGLLDARFRGPGGAVCGEAPRSMSVIHDVQLVPQTKQRSCWAAAAAMVRGWKMGIKYTDREIAATTGRLGMMKTGEPPVDVPAFASSLGLVVGETSHNYSIEGLYELLSSGPLWVAADISGTHVKVIYGMVGDGTPDGTILQVADPSPPGSGSRYSLNMYQFAREYEKEFEKTGYMTVQIIHP